MGDGDRLHKEMDIILPEQNFHSFYRNILVFCASALGCAGLSITLFLNKFNF